MCKNCPICNDLKDLEEALTNPKAYWYDLEDKKVRLHGVETQLQGQSTLDECVEEYGCGSAKRKCCVVENLPLHIGSRIGFVKFVRKWEPH